MDIYVRAVSIDIMLSFNVKQPVHAIDYPFVVVVVVVNSPFDYK